MYANKQLADAERKGYERGRNEKEVEATREWMPWKKLLKAGWFIVGMNHYRVAGGQLCLYCSMVRKGRCITAQGSDARQVFKDLEEKSNDIRNDARA